MLKITSALLILSLTPAGVFAAESDLSLKVRGLIDLFDGGIGVDAGKTCF